MKIAAPLFFASASALETSSTAQTLLAAVGHRNVTHMEALVQGLADESVQIPAWKFDEDIRTALDAIRAIFVGNIQKALKDAHKENQEHLNLQTSECFMGCINNYRKASGSCMDMDKQCGMALEEHQSCRVEVYKSYITMAKSCASLHCFIRNWKDEECPFEDCLCPDLMVCHRAGGGYDETCVAQIGDCKGTYGSWLARMIQKFKSGFTEWQGLHGACKSSYHWFLSVDMDCDASQKKFESCKCQQHGCSERSCSVEFEQCQIGCWDRYEVIITETECLEKDRKIDWSATKKIECYVDILLHEYTKEELLTKCGTEECVNVAREEDYKHCHTICIEVDHEGEWPEVHSVALACDNDPVPYAGGKQSDDQTVWIAGHGPRSHHDQYHLGDGHFKYDSNGAEVFTRHRGGAQDRAGENRCTEHLDIDYQIPPCCDCDPPPPPVCDEKFHCDYYFGYDDTTLISDISDCCPEECGATCFTDVHIIGNVRGKKGECVIETNEDLHQGSTAPWRPRYFHEMRTMLSMSEHSHAWAYNRCQCETCVTTMPVYEGRQGKYMCGAGPHTLLKKVGY